MSNISKVFNPPTKSTKVENCLGCDVFNSIFLIGGGSYLLSSKLIKRDKKVSIQEYNKLHPKWWRSSIKGLGGALVIFGAYRVFESYSNWKKGFYDIRQNDENHDIET